VRESLMYLRAELIVASLMFSFPLLKIKIKNNLCLGLTVL